MILGNILHNIGSEWHRAEISGIKFAKIYFPILLTDVFRKLKFDVGIMSKWLGRFNGAAGKASSEMQ